MVAADEDSLICDFAEYYHIYNWRGLPLTLAATLACGLCGDSRIMMRLSGAKAKQDTLFLAAIIDRLSVLAWQNTEDGQKGRNVPESIVNKLIGNHEERTMSFKDGAAFDAAYNKLVEEITNG